VSTSSRCSCRCTSPRRRQTMDKMILIPYDRYQNLVGERKRSKSQKGVGTKMKQPALGPPGIPNKGYKTWITLWTSENCAIFFYVSSISIVLCMMCFCQ
jgi:hypothetical protein